MCNYVKIETGRNFPKNVRRRLRRILMLLSVHMTGILFLVRFNNFTRLWAYIGVTRSSSNRPFLCALDPFIWSSPPSINPSTTHYSFIPPSSSIVIPPFFLHSFSPPPFSPSIHPSIHHQSVHSNLTIHYSFISPCPSINDHLSVNQSILPSTSPSSHYHCLPVYAGAHPPLIRNIPRAIQEMISR